MKNKLTRRAIRSFVTIVMIALSFRYQKMDQMWNAIKLALKFRGLSTSGLSLLTGTGLGSSRSKSQRIYKKMTSDEKQKADDMEPTVEWADNFNRNLAVQLPKSNEVYKSCQWTVVAAKHHPFLKDKPMFIEQSQINRTSTLPDITQFSMDETDYYEDILTEDIDKDHLTHSLVARYNVRSVPLKITKEGLEGVHDSGSKEYKKLLKTLLKKVDGPRHMTPLKLMGSNIGSTEGMISYLKDTVERRTPGTIKIIVVDCQTFWRLIKVTTLNKK